MEHAIATEMPLALFTTLAPISAGAFIALAIAFFTVEFSEKQIKLLDKLSFIPLAVLAAAFIAAFFHLASPLNAINAFNGIGRSPLSNEILAGVVFGALLLVYCIVAVMGKLNGSVRKGFAALVAVVGLVFAYFIGTAYAIPTIISWNTPLIPVSIIGFTLLGGGLLGTLMIAAAGGLSEARKTSFKIALLIVAVIGVALSVGCVWAHYAMVSGIETTIVSGAELASGLMMYLVASSICAVVAFACVTLALLKVDGPVVVAIGLVVMIAAILIARLVFYAMQVSAGL
jgi:anaerobic dimethyl sulfoxide reductase subunit C (anchor subunit)/Tat-targeted selenate reductase subunit YnfH